MFGRGLDLLSLGEIICELLEGRLAKLRLWPEVRGQVGIGACNGSKGGLG